MGAYFSETVEPNQSFLGGIIDAALPDEFGIAVSVGSNRVQGHEQTLNYGIGGRVAGYITVSQEDAESYFEGIDVNLGGMAGPDDAGQITEMRQYVFTEWDPTATSDMEALASVFDTNGDGVLSGAELANFRIMVTNADGNQTKDAA